MRLLDNVKNLLLRRFVLVLAVVVLGTTPFIHLPRVLGVFKLAGEMQQYRKQALSVPLTRPTEAQVLGWERAVPEADLMEPPRFMVALRQLARRSGCTLGETQDTQPVPVEGRDDLSTIDSTVKVQGPYPALVRLANVLQQDTRVLAVTRAAISAEHYPQLEADLTIRRYLRRSSNDVTIQ